MAERTENKKQIASIISPADLERNINILYEKVERLEDLVERLYHTVESYNEYMPKLTDVLIKYFPAMSNYRKEMEVMMMIHRGFLERVERQIQEHRSNREVHFSDKKHRLSKYD